MITVFDSYSKFKLHSLAKPTHMARKEFKKHHKRAFTCVRAAESHFVALDNRGYVWSWGVPNLHGELLRRSPAHMGDNNPGSVLQLLTPRLIPALEGIEMAHIATNGWVTACLSRETHDIYIWGWMDSGARIVGMPAVSGGDVAGIIDQFDEEENLTVVSIGVASGYVALVIEDSTTGRSSLYIAQPPAEHSLQHNPAASADQNEEDGTTFRKVSGPWDTLLKTDDEIYRRPSLICSPAATFVAVARGY